MNELTDKMEIVDKSVIKNLDLSNNISIISELNNNKYLIKYSGVIDDRVKGLYSNDILTLNKIVKNNKEKLKDLALNRTRKISSAVHIAAAISSYARILINEYKNIPDNPCIMSDTDSVILTKPLRNNLVGTDIGKMKLEQIIKQGIFIKKKLYCLINPDNKERIVSSGIDSSKLNYNSFEQLLYGESIEVESTKFNVDWKTLNIKVVKSKLKIYGLRGYVKTIYNTPNVNFKFISFPVKYNVIVHPLYPYALEIISKNNTIKKRNISQPDHREVDQEESDNFILFSKFELNLFIFFLLLSIIVLIIYIFIYK